jgi:hypothetical protein
MFTKDVGAVFHLKAGSSVLALPAFLPSKVTSMASLEGHLKEKQQMHVKPNLF